MGALDSEMSACRREAQVVRSFHNVRKRLPPALRNRVALCNVDLLYPDPEIGTQKPGDRKRV